MATLIDDNGSLITLTRTVLVVPDAAEDPVGDEINPSAPGTPVISNAIATSLTLTWAAATDDVAVTGYRVFQDGVLITSVATLSADVSGLEFATTYAFTVTAVDAAGNESDPSEPAVYLSPGGPGDTAEAPALTLTVSPGVAQAAPPLPPGPGNDRRVNAVEVVIAADGATFTSAPIAASTARVNYDPADEGNGPDDLDDGTFRSVWWTYRPTRDGVMSIAASATGNTETVYATYYAFDAGDVRGASEIIEAGTPQSFVVFAGQRFDIAMHQMADDPQPVTYTLQVTGPASMVEPTGPPVLTALEPATGVRDTTPVVTIIGTGFSETELWTMVDGPGGVSLAGYTFISDTQVDTAMVIDARAAYGEHDLTVTTSLGSSNPLPFTLPPPDPNLAAPPLGVSAAVSGFARASRTARAPAVHVSVSAQARTPHDVAAPAVQVAVTAKDPVSPLASLTLSAPAPGEVVTTDFPQFMVGLTSTEDPETAYTVEIQYDDNAAFTSATLISTDIEVGDGGALVTPTVAVSATTYWRARLFDATATLSVDWTASQSFTVDSSVQSSDIAITWTVSASAAREIHLWHFVPEGAEVGETVTAYGQGFPNAGNITVAGVAAEITDWELVAADDGLAPTATINGATVTVEHFKVSFITPDVPEPGGPAAVEA